MKDGPSIAATAALIGDPARANILVALMDGRALTVTELAHAAGTSIPTASGHIAKLSEAGFLAMRKQGRHRYLSLSGPDVADVIERLMGLAGRTGARRTRTGPRDPALRTARLCYDHLAGASGVQLYRSLVARGFVADEAEPAVTEDGVLFLADLGVDFRGLARARRPLCLRCLDWSERRHHLAGALGAAMLVRLVDLGWARRAEGRVIRFTPAGEAAFTRAFPPDP
jgi:DNA-binding transcriptional ArsR family regulator